MFLLMAGLSESFITKSNFDPQLIGEIIFQMNEFQQAGRLVERPEYQDAIRVVHAEYTSQTLPTYDSDTSQAKSFFMG